MQETIQHKVFDWRCPRCESANAGWREICRICGLDSAQMSGGHYFGRHTVTPVEERAEQDAAGKK